MSIDYEDIVIAPPEQEHPLTQPEIDVRESFVREYLIDYDYRSAAIRIGFHEGIAQHYARKFQYDPYVKRRIAEATTAQYDDPEAVKAQQRQRVLSSLMKEANYTGPGASHAARVSALAKLAQIHGLEAPTKSESKVIHEGGQDINVNHSFDFSKLDTDDLGMVRQLLTKQVERDDQRN